MKAFATCIGIGCNCTISATSGLPFGAYAPLSGSDKDSTGVVSVTCSALVAGLNVSYAVSLNAGNNGTLAVRKMINGSVLMNYNIYTDAARTTIWGDGTGGTSVINDSYTIVLLSVTRNYTMYGRIPGSQTTMITGSYSDTITATVTY